MASNEWLLLTTQLPSKPSSLRVNIWRRLKNTGACNLQNGLWILPKNEKTLIFMERLLGTIRENNANGQIFVLQALNQSIEDDIINQFNKDREEEYSEVIEQCQLFIDELERETAIEKFTFAELEENEQNVKRFSNWLKKIRHRDFFDTKKYQEAQRSFEKCHQEVQKYTQKLYELEGIGDNETELNNKETFQVRDELDGIN